MIKRCCCPIFPRIILQKQLDKILGLTDLGLYISLLGGVKFNFDVGH